MKIVKPEPACQEDKAYIAYIDEHRKNVNTAFISFGKIICLALSMVHGEYDVLRRYVKNHDASKYSEEEFSGYRQWFYPEKDKEKDSILFKKAWEHHYKNNPHHWEYFLENGTAKEMSKLNIAEMLLDWIAMSMKFKNNPADWYKENKDRIVLHKETRSQVELTLAILASQSVYPFKLKKNKSGRRARIKNEK